MADGSARELNPGDHIGRYVVVRPLGPRRHGRGLRGPRRAAGPRCRSEDDRRPGGRDGALAILARSPRRGERQPSAYLPGLRSGRIAGGDLPDDGAPRRRSPGSPARSGRLDAAGSRAHRAGHAWRPVRAARAGPGASRRQTIERLPDATWSQAARLRPRPAGAVGLPADSVRRHRAGDRRRHDRRHAAIHGARAGDGSRTRWAHRPVCVGGGAVPHAGGPAAVYGQRRRCAVCGAEGESAGAAGAAGGGRDRSRHSSRHAQGRRRALLHRGTRWRRISQLCRYQELTASPRFRYAH